MPIGPLGQPPVNRINDVPSANDTSKTEGNQATFSLTTPAQSESAPATPAMIAARLIQNARASKASGNEASLQAPLGDLLGAVASQMGVDNLSNESRQKLAARLADDPVVKSLIG